MTTLLKAAGVFAREFALTCLKVIIAIAFARQTATSFAVAEHLERKTGRRL